MPHLFIILLKINLVLILFAIGYYLVLRRLTFYTLNRAFLIFGILFSSAYPFIDLTEFFHKQEVNQQVALIVPKLNQSVNNLIPTDFITLNWHIISYIFYVGLVLMLIRLAFQFISLYKVHQKSFPGTISNYPVRFLKEPVSPFSFWQTVYLNPDLHNKNELNTILEHEKVHVKQWHTLDIILAELSVVFYWFNPGVWLMKKAVKENLEFITDERILKNGIDKKTYQYSLLDVGNLAPSVEIVNNFNLSDLKKRIKMMNAKRSSRLTLCRYLVLTNILLFTTLIFTVSKKDINKHLLPIKQLLIENHIINKEPTVVKVQESTKAKINYALKPNGLASDKSPIVKLVVKTDSILNLSSTLSIIAEAKNNALEGKKHFFFNVKKNTETTEIPEIAGAYHVMKMSKISSHDGKKMDTIKVFAYRSDKIDSESQAMLKKIIEVKLSDTLNTNKNPSYSINGKRATFEAFRDIIKAGDIKNISVQDDTQEPQIFITTKTN